MMLAEAVRSVAALGGRAGWHLSVLGLRWRVDFVAVLVHVVPMRRQIGLVWLYLCVR